MTASKQVFLTGEKVELRPLALTDVSGNYSSWLNDPEVCAFNSHGRFPMSVARLEAYVKQVTSSPTELVLAIMARENGLHIGNISLQSIQWVDRSAEFAILVGEKKFWGKGLAREASELILRHGFLELNLNRIHCGTSEDNSGMQELAAKLGMREEGRLRQALFKHGKFVDVIQYGLLQEEFRGRS